jgi:hypothetical protein
MNKIIYDSIRYKYNKVPKNMNKIIYNGIV